VNRGQILLIIGIVELGIIVLTGAVICLLSK
jgi:hypothetical protein